MKCGIDTRFLGISLSISKHLSLQLYYYYIMNIHDIWSDFIGWFPFSRERLTAVEGIHVLPVMLLVKCFMAFDDFTILFLLHSFWDIQIINIISNNYYIKCQNKNVNIVNIVENVYSIPYSW